MSKTKARTVGERKREKKAAKERFAELSAANAIPRREPNGRLSRAGEEKPKHAAVVARCKAMGWLPRRLDDGSLSYLPTADLVARATQEHLGCVAGQALHDVDPVSRIPLWQAVCAIRTAYTRYWAYTGVQPPYAKPAMLPIKPDPGSTGVDVSGKRTVDTRTEGEKAHDATVAMMRIEQVLGMAGGASYVKRIVLDEESSAVTDRARLVRGLAAVAEEVLKL